MKTGCEATITGNNTVQNLFKPPPLFKQSGFMTLKLITLSTLSTTIRHTYAFGIDILLLWPLLANSRLTLRNVTSQLLVSFSLKLYTGYVFIYLLVCSIPVHCCNIATCVFMLILHVSLYIPSSIQPDMQKRATRHTALWTCSCAACCPREN